MTYRRPDPILLAIAGPAGVGKSTLAGRIIDHLSDRGVAVERRSLALPLRMALRCLLPVSSRHLATDTSQAAKAATIPGSAEVATVRDLLCALGDLCHDHLHEEWLTHLLDRHLAGAWPDLGVVVVDDLRRESEARWFRSRHALVIHLRRAGIDYTRQHATEQGLTPAGCDYVFDLPGDLPSLDHLAADLAGICVNRLRALRGDDADADGRTLGPIAPAAASDLDPSLIGPAA